MPGLVRRLGGVVLMASLIALGAYLQVPVRPVPISLQTFFVLLGGFVLGPVAGAGAGALYLLAGAAGLPVFAGGTAGVAKLFGPTGGFLLSFPLMAAIAGLARRDALPLSWPLSWKRGLLWGGVATALTLLLGMTWLEAALGLGWREAFAVGVLPYLPGAFFKLVFAIVVSRWLERQRWRAVTRADPATTRRS